MGKSIETESRLMVASEGRWRVGRDGFRGTSFLWDDESVLDLDRGDGYSASRMD